MIRVHVQPNDGGWGVFESGAQVAEGTDSAEAEAAARDYLRAQGGGEMLLHLGDQKPPKLIRVTD